MIEVSAETRAAIKRLLKNKNNSNAGSGRVLMIATHPAMKKDIGEPILDGRDICARRAGKNA